MIKHDILNRYTNKVQFTAEIDCDENADISLKRGLAVKWAIDNDADLSDADLSYADLSGASINNCVSGISDYIKSISLETYNIVYTKDMMFIGCESHSIEEWRNFGDARIIEMDGKTALKFWRKYKDFIFTAIDLAPALPTKGDA